MAKVFISYSRKDIEFAKRLTVELQKSDLDFWIDWEGIPPTVDWWKEIQKGIEEADVFLFLISPDSAKSKVCGQEIDTAVKNGKRIIPIVVREIEWQDTPPQLGHLNYIFFSRDDDFDSAVKKLMTAIHTDYEWAATHRRIQVKALEWSRKNKEHSLLLRGKDLQEAELQLADNASKSPLPTDLQRKYVLESRQDANRQRRLRFVTITMVGFALLLIGYLALSGQLNKLIYRPIAMQWTTIPAGEFIMGSDNGIPSEGPSHGIFLDTYQIGTYEVTNQQYNQCVKAGVCPMPRLPTHDRLEQSDNPVVGVTWEDGNTFCIWADSHGRLPTEAEWEKSARGTDERTFPWGKKLDCTHANYQNSELGPGCVGDTVAINSYKNGVSPYGVYNMAGNAAEWVWDWYEAAYYATSPSKNPLGPDKGITKVVRGGSFNGMGIALRTTYRGEEPPKSTSEGLGFRCARDIEK